MSTDIVQTTTSPDKINNLFTTLRTHQTLLAAVTHLHQTLTDHLSSLDQSLSQRSQTLDSQIQALDKKTKQTVDSLETRENAVADRFSTASALVEARKLAALSAAAAGGGGETVVRDYFRVMDWKGLIGFVVMKKGKAVGDRGEGTALREEIAVAAAEAVDGMRMVLEAVDDFVDSRVAGEVAALADRRWACGVLIQAVVESGESGGGVGRGMKERVVRVLEKWKGVMGRENGGFGSGEARMFLQVVIGFGLKEMVGEEFLRKLLVQYTTNRQIGQFAKLAWTLGLADQIKDIVEELAKSRKNVHTISKSGKYCASALEEANDLELNATVAMLQCAEDNKLESKSTIDSLWKRVQQLEKAKEEIKNKNAPTSTSKPPNKRGQGGGGGQPYYPPKTGRFSNASPASRSLQATPATFRTPYKNASWPNRHMYDGPGPASYGQGYGGAAVVRASGSYGGAPAGGSYGGPPDSGSYGGPSAGGLYIGLPASGSFSVALTGELYGGPLADGLYAGGRGAQAVGSYSRHGSYAGPRNFGSGSYDSSAASAPAYPPYHH